MRVNEFVNDPEQCYADEKVFPSVTRLDGTYYIESEYYTVETTNAGTSWCRLWIRVRCPEKPWHQYHESYGYYYLGLEATVNVNPQTGEWVFDDGFCTSVI